jgi:branched-chain amino acid transport system permease protein
LERVIVFEGREKRINIDLEREGDEAVAAGPSFAERFANLLVSGTRFGLVIALCSVGLTLIYATTGLVNFAHGELVTFGALVAFWASSSGGLGLPLVVAGLVAVVVAGAFGAAQDVVLWEPLRRRRAGNVSTIVISIGLSIMLRNVYLVLFEGNPRAYAQFATQAPIDIGFVSVQVKELVSIALCVTVLAATGALLRYTRLGTAVRAVSNEPQLARASGVDVRRVVFTVWVAGAMLAGAGGVLLGLTEGVQWNMGLRILLLMFAAVVVGGLGSPAGALIGGVLIGVVSELSSLWIPSDFKTVVALVALILVLLVRPQGIMGLRERVG